MNKPAAASSLQQLTARFKPPSGPAIVCQMVCVWWLEPCPSRPHHIRVTFKMCCCEPPGLRPTFWQVLGLGLKARSRSWLSLLAAIHWAASGETLNLPPLCHIPDDKTPLTSHQPFGSILNCCALLIAGSPQTLPRRYFSWDPPAHLASSPGRVSCWMVAAPWHSRRATR